MRFLCLAFHDVTPVCDVKVVLLTNCFTIPPYQFLSTKNINLCARITGILSIIAYNGPYLFKEIHSSVISLSMDVKVVPPTEQTEPFLSTKMCPLCPNHMNSLNNYFHLQTTIKTIWLGVFLSFLRHFSLQVECWRYPFVGLFCQFLSTKKCKSWCSNNVNSFKHSRTAYFIYSKIQRWAMKYMTTLFNSCKGFPFNSELHQLLSAQLVSSLFGVKVFQTVLQVYVNVSAQVTWILSKIAHSLLDLFKVNHPGVVS